ncbi:MAG: beta-ketoacyl synthase chain length factor [Mediterranea sp.]|jgi:3-oxoacyl-(acyl-carrier-protein) synthase|nr:beta-ketoacyl synthase chain length factor [Mediterranea sp.]
MKKRKVYIQAMAQISIQNPLTDEWIHRPVVHNTSYVRSIDPNFRDFLSSAESRRMGKLLKRALVTSLEVIRKSGIECPDAIITGTGLGCIENTEFFLDALCRNGEQLLKPTHFMQSTHNTISSLIGIHTKTYGYNITYAHKGVSFDSALQDAWTQFQLELIDSALIGGHDEMTPSYFTLLKKAKFVGQDREVCGETAVSVMLGSDKTKGLCLLSGFKLMYKPEMERLKRELSHMLDGAGISLDEIDAVMTGISGNELNDSYYQDVLPKLFGDIPILHYKHVFGESYTAPGLGFYAAACCLLYGKIPAFLYMDQSKAATSRPNYILLFNLFEGKSCSLILLEDICGK